jgi:hypothetical protein
MDFDTQKITVLKEELRRDLEALERVERLMAAKNGIVAPVDDKQLPLHVADEYDTEAPVDSLRGTIESIINSDPNARWTTQKVLARLKEMKYDLRAKQPIYSVGQTLNVLVKKGRIRIARKGAGSSPNIYKGKIQDVGPTRDQEGIVRDSTLTQ